MRIRAPAPAKRCGLALLLTCTAVPLIAADSVPMRTIEGRVVAVDRYLGEGGVEVVQATLGVPGGPEGGVPVLLAPESVCAQIGFQVAEGDRLRARIFVTADHPSRVQKVQNFTQGTMVRLRTLHATPLWNSVGMWQGGPLRTAPGRHRYGRNPGGGGPPR